ncbi:hypothetical protein F8388_003142 [Cannabis sativa]|uniref:Uncharacterized protein n=1 Tax=Cannabis sativa TaxID=3483 RepID=A0A7J6E8P0_CANSA|nr:hypothetical protein F8388_003142 [Cannabis sativa]KAF4398671.1 hypothetical protein G4B88_017097 [Cannabis sativa]
MYIDWFELRKRKFKDVVFDKDNTITAPYQLNLWAPLASSLDECKAVFRPNIVVFSNSADEAPVVGSVGGEEAMLIGVLITQTQWNRRRKPMEWNGMNGTQTPMGSVRWRKMVAENRSYRPKTTYNLLQIPLFGLCIEIYVVGGCGWDPGVGAGVGLGLAGVSRVKKPAGTTGEVEKHFGGEASQLIMVDQNKTH